MKKVACYLYLGMFKKNMKSCHKINEGKCMKKIVMKTIAGHMTL